MKAIYLAGTFLLGLTLLGSATFSENTGSITVTVFEGDSPSVEALVGVATSAENLENMTYKYEGETNSKGIVSFNNVPEGVYYVDASSEEAYGEGKVEVKDGNATLTIKMTEE